jgi:AcrR family transcriptional regulator
MMQERSKETHDSLLAAALEQFAKNGYDATSVLQICQAAGVSKGAFYHHFPSKQALFLELLDTWLNILDVQFNLIRAQASSIPEALITMTELMGEIYRSAGGNLPMFLEFWSQAQHNPEIWQSVINPYHRYRCYFAEMIQEGIEEGSLKALDPQMTAQVMVAMAVGLLLQGLLDPQGTDWQQVTKHGFQMILNDLLVMGRQ